MNMKKPILILLFTLTLSLAACGIYQTKGTTPQVETTPIVAEAIGFKDIQDRIINPSCIQCHNASDPKGGIALDSYALVKANLGLIENEVLTQKTMPPSQALIPAQLQVLSDWIQNGAPEVGSITANTPTPTPSSSPRATPSPTPRGTPTPTPTSTPSYIVYQNVKDKIFTPSCISCHSGSRPSAGVTLNTYTTVKMNLSAVEDTVITQGTMPPRGSITNSNLNLLQTWIDEGAPEK